ncbi:Uma2 family endonuclease [Kribbella sp. CA-293567]|uniref:Uma2 family endonuclease n=1 Tax=Kribbella sp. CA-293567 TaxID=3002436 RepID=UPI0022DDC183|nr:Uma2 family endonuclease [Kribbella sp. CA-293567]WBQ07068.1 Uma2 family endonuclease [Kribbella sp. CA-293567]
MIESLTNLGEAPPVRAERAPDSRRYEVIDGRMVVTGVQPPAHQAAVVALMVLLKQACPAGLLVSVGSLGFRPTRRLLLRPDLLVTSRAEAGPAYVENAVLAVEVLSPTTRVADVVTKRELYAAHGVPAYWLLDPGTQELTVLQLTGEHYVCEAVLQGEEAFTTSFPFPVTLSPAQLLS